MTDPLLFEARGTPRPKARARNIGGRMVSTTGKLEKLWRSAVDRAIARAVANRGDPTPLFTGAVRVRMVFTFLAPPNKPERVGQPHTFKPDADNLAKTVLDRMERGGVFKNDSQVAQCPVEKWWGRRFGVVVTVEPIETERLNAPSSVETAAPDWLLDGLGLSASA